MDEQKRDFKGVWIPKEIWESTDLTAIEKVVFAELNSLCGEKGCYASNEYLAKFCQCSVPTITRTIAKLKSLGYIDSISYDGRSRVIKMIRVINLINQTNHNDEADSSKRLGRVITVISRDNNILNNIDNSINIPPIVPQEFDVFWNAYPKKVGKKEAEKSFKKVKVGLDVLLAAIEQQKKSRQWNEGFIPNASTWLNQERWNDILDVPKDKFTESVDMLSDWIRSAENDGN